MKLDRLSNEELDVWVCDCGAYTPVKKGSTMPVCEYCRRVVFRLEIDVLEARLLEMPNFVYEDRGEIIKTHDFIKKIFEELFGGKT